MLIPHWDDLFQEVSRRRVGAGYKLTGAEEITWRGRLGKRLVDAVSRVRLNDPMEGFMTSSNHRLRDSHVGRAGHWVDIRVTTRVTDEELAVIAQAASAADSRRVEVSRGRHPPIACHSGRL